MQPFLFRFPLALLALLLSLSGAQAKGLVTYTQTPGALPSQEFTLTVDGQPVLVEKFGDVHYARFAFTTDAALEVGLKNGSIASHRISPVSRQVQGRANGPALAFSLPKPGSYIVQINNLEKLLILSDTPEHLDFKIGDPQVKVLTDYLPANRDPQAPVTAEFQKAIDETSAQAGGGVLVVPNGRYVAGQLKLKSNMRLHLESGALVQAMPVMTPESYPLHHATHAKGDTAFIYLEDARNVRITGRGILDGNGRAITKTYGNNAKIKLVRTAEARDLVLEDIMLRDSQRWTLHLLKSDNVSIRNLKIVNDLSGQHDLQKKVHKLDVPNTDGIDIDACVNVAVEDSFVYTGDDAITPKVTNYLGLKQPCRNLTLRNNVLWCYKAALKVGDESAEDMHDILFENNDIIRADRALAVWSGDGGKLYNIRFLNTHAEFIGGDYNERFFYLRAQKRHDATPGPVDGIEIRGFYALEPAVQESTIRGFSEEVPVSNVTFQDIVIKGRAAKTLEDIPLEIRKFTRNIVLKPAGN